MNYHHSFPLAGGLVLLLAGCYTARPMEVPVPLPETRVIAQVTDTGAVAMGGRIGPGAVEVEGIVASADANVWNLNLLRVDQRGGTSVLWNRELVSFPRNALARPTENRLDKPKSWGAAALVLATAIVAAKAFKALGADAPTDGTPIPQNIIIWGGGR